MRDEKSPEGAFGNVDKMTHTFHHRSWPGWSIINYFLGFTFSDISPFWKILLNMPKQMLMMFLLKLHIRASYLEFSSTAGRNETVFWIYQLLAWIDKEPGGISCKSDELWIPIWDVCKKKVCFKRETQFLSVWEKEKKKTQVIFKLREIGL